MQEAAYSTTDYTATLVNFNIWTFVQPKHLKTEACELPNAGPVSGFKQGLLAVRLNYKKIKTSFFI